MKLKFIVCSLLCCLFVVPASSINAGAPPTLFEPPADAVIGQQFIQEGSGVLCTLYGEVRMGLLYTYWSTHEGRESVECMPVIAGAPPRILFFDPPETIQVYPDVDKRITFKVAFPDAFNEARQGSYLVKMYIVDTKTGIVFKVNQYSGLPYKEDTLEPFTGVIRFSAAYGLQADIYGGINFDSRYKQLLNIRYMGAGVYNFVIEVIDGNNNSSYAAVPINIEYMGE